SSDLYTTGRKTHDHTSVDIELETGRTQQIRVHFAHIGHPLAGDNLYGGSCQRINRQALHCCELILHHPITKKRLVFTSALPNDMVKLFATRKCLPVEDRKSTRLNSSHVSITYDVFCL